LNEKRLVCHLSAWGVPTVLVILFISVGGRFGGDHDSILLFCFIDHSLRDDEWLDYVTWFGPIAIMAITGLVLVVSCLVVITRSHRINQSHKHGIGLLEQQARPIIFVLSFFGLFFWLFIWRVQYSVQSKIYLKSLHQWTACMIHSSFNVNSCGSSPAEHLTAWIWYGLHIVMSFQGAILTLTWGTQQATLKLWFRLIQCHQVSHETPLSTSRRQTEMSSLQTEIRSAPSVLPSTTPGDESNLIGSFELPDLGSSQQPHTNQNINLEDPVSVSTSNSFESASQHGKKTTNFSPNDALPEEEMDYVA